MKKIILLLLTLAASFGAEDGAIRIIRSGAQPYLTEPSLVTITALSNLFAGTVTSTGLVTGLRFETTSSDPGEVLINGPSGGSFAFTNNSSAVYRLSLPASGLSGPVLFNVIGTNISLVQFTNSITFALSDMTTALTTGTNKNYWYAPAAGMTIKGVRLTLATASSSGTPTVDINEAGTTILSTKLTVDQDEWDSVNATAAAVISDDEIAGNAKLDFDIDVAGTGAAGAQVQILYTVP